MATHFPDNVSIPDDPEERLTAFVNFCNETIASVPDTRRAMSAILEFIVRATGATGAAIALPECDALVVSTATANCERRPGERISLTSTAGTAFRERKTILANTTSDPRTDPTRAYARIGTTVISPIMHGRRTYGVLLSRYPAPHGVESKEAHAVNEFGSVAGGVLGSSFYLEENARTNAIDPLTRLGNLRGYERDLGAQFTLYRRFGVPFCLALFDVKSADRDVWARTGLALQDQIRKTDAGFALENGLFAVLLKNCSGQHSAAALSRIETPLPQHTHAALASPWPSESLRAFRARAQRLLTQTSNEKTSQSPPGRSVWERFARASLTGPSTGSR